MVGNQSWGVIALELAEIEFAFVSGEEEQTLLGECLQAFEAEEANPGNQEVGVGEVMLVVAQQGLQLGI